MFDVKLIINGQEFPIHYKMLRMIADNIPEAKNYAPLSQLLLKLNIPSITQKLVEREHFSIDDFDNLWEKGNLSLKRKLMEQDKFRANLTDMQAEQIIKMNDPEILMNLASNAEQLYPMNDQKQAMRLSGKMADTLLEFIATHPVQEIRQELIENQSAPAKFKPSISERLQKGFRIRSDDIGDLTLNDFNSLSIASTDNLKSIARNFHLIKDKKMRSKVSDFLCSHPDPIVRLKLAKNRRASYSIYQRLATDPDADVAQAAKDSMVEE